MAKVYKGVGRRMAKLAGNHTVMDGAAEKIRARATANASVHHKTGEYSANFKVKRARSKVGGVMDRMVYNDHPAALAIEYGHFVYTTRGPARFVPGQFNLTRAVMG